MGSKNAYDNNTIKLDVSRSCQSISAVAKQEIDPGMLIGQGAADPQVSGYFFQFVRHQQTGGYAESLFATEDVITGGTIETPYLVGQIVSAVVFKRGDMVLAWVDEATVTFGQRLISAGNGMLRIPEVPATPGYYIAVSLEEFDLVPPVLPPRLTKVVIM